MSTFVVENTALFTENVFLSHNKNLAVGGAVTVTGPAEFNSGVNVAGSVTVNSNGENEKFTVDGPSELKGNTTITGTATASSTLVLGGGTNLTLSAVDTSGTNKIGSHASTRHLKLTDSSNETWTIPLLTGGNQIDTSQIQGALALNGNLQFRGFISLIYSTDHNKWVLDTGGNPNLFANWYTGADALDPNSAGYVVGSEESSVAKNYFLTAGSYYLVRFAATESAVQPYSVTLSELIGLLSDGNFLNQSSSSGPNWYASNHFNSFAQTGEYEVHTSDQILIERSAQTDYKVTVTVVDNSDSFQKRLISDTKVVLPMPTTKETLIIDGSSVSFDGGVAIDSTGVDEKFTVSGPTEITGSVSLISNAGDEKFDVSGPTNITGSTTVTGNVYISSIGLGDSFTVNGPTYIQGGTTVYGGAVLIEAKGNAGYKGSDTVTLQSTAGSVNVESSVDTSISAGANATLEATTSCTVQSTNGDTTVASLNSGLILGSGTTSTLTAGGDATISSSSDIALNANEPSKKIVLSASSGSVNIASDTSTYTSNNIHFASDSENAVVRFSKSTAVALGGSRHVHRAYDSSVAYNGDGNGYGIRLDLVRATAGNDVSHDHITVMDVVVIGQNAAGVGSKIKSFFKGTFIIDHSCSSVIDGVGTYALSTEVGNYYKNQYTKVYFVNNANANAQNPLWRLCVHWDPPDNNWTNFSGDSKFSAYVTTHTSDDHHHSYFKLVARGKSSSATEDGTDAGAIPGGTYLT